MSKPACGLFRGTKGDRAIAGDAESVIAARAKGLDLSEHPIGQKQLSSGQRRSIAQKIKNRTATKEEYRRYMWDRRLGRRRKNGIDEFWAQEALRLSMGQKGTRNWSAEQREAILAGKKPKYNGRTLESHHTYSVARYPHLANRGLLFTRQHISNITRHGMAGRIVRANLAKGIVTFRSSRRLS